VIKLLSAFDLTAESALLLRNGMVSCPALYDTALATIKYDISKTTGNGDVTKIKCPVQYFYGLKDL